MIDLGCREKAEVMGICQHIDAKGPIVSAGVCKYGPNKKWRLQCPSYSYRRKKQSGQGREEKQKERQGSMLAVSELINLNTGIFEKYKV